MLFEQINAEYLGGVDDVSFLTSRAAGGSGSICLAALGAPGAVLQESTGLEEIEALGASLPC
jgi:hypothetical protein